MANLQRFLYSLLLHALLPLASLRLAWLAMRNPGYGERWWERFGLVSRAGTVGQVICIHAVSVGEVLSAGTLIPRLRALFPGARILVTTVTPTGADMVARRLDDGVSHAYFPYDLSWAVRGFLRRLRPRMVLVMETELWPNFYAACRDMGIPLVMVNARISPRSFSGYSRFLRLARETLDCVTYVAAQTAADAQRFRELGAADDRVGVFGNLKFDMPVSVGVSEQGQALRREFSNDRLIWVAASTHAGEERMVLAALERVQQEYPNCLLILAPRHPERFDEVAGLCRSAGLAMIRRSMRIPVGADTRVFLLDSLGELLSYYACSDVAFVGGSLVPAGGHNLLEPANLGMPILTGPHTFNFTEATELLTRAGGVRVVRDAAELATHLCELLGDANLRHAMGEAARRVCETNRGAAERVMQLLRVLPATPGVPESPHG